jgi:iron uptake system component EfeO
MRSRRLLTLVAVGAGLAAPLTGCSSGGQPSNVIDVSQSQCGTAWQVPGPGWHTLQISNQGTAGA